MKQWKLQIVLQYIRLYFITVAINCYLERANNKL